MYVIPRDQVGTADGSGRNEKEGSLRTINGINGINGIPFTEFTSFFSRLPERLNKKWTDFIQES